MLDDIEIAKLKQEHGAIFSVDIGSTEYVFRALTIGEFKYITDLDMASVDAEDYILEKTLLYPQDANFDKTPAGVVSSLAEEVLDSSGFLSLDTIEEEIAEARLEVTSILEMMKAFIVAAMPSTSYSDFANMTFNQIVKLLAFSERVLELKTGIARGSTMTFQFAEEEAEPVKPSFTEEDIQKANRALRNDSSTGLGTAVSGDPIAAKLKQALGG